MTLDYSFDDLDGQYGDQKVEDRNSPVPDGTYQVEVQKFEPGLTKAAGNRMFKWTLRILGPNHAKRMIFKNSIIDHQDSEKRGKLLAMLKNDIAVSGVKIDKLSELGDAKVRERFLNLQLEVNVVQNGDFQNIYFRKRLEGVATGTRAGSADVGANGSKNGGHPVGAGSIGRPAVSGGSGGVGSPADEAPF